MRRQFAGILYTGIGSHNFLLKQIKKFEKAVNERDENQKNIRTKKELIRQGIDEKVL